MKVVLLKNVPGLGKTGEVVQVNDGYARNYLIPRKCACLASASNVSHGQAEARRQTEEATKRHEQQLALVEKLEGVSVTVSAHAGDEGKLFGSVNPQVIAEALAEQGLEIDKKLIDMETPIRELGVFPVLIRFSPEVIAEVKVWVVKG